jgi:hypothetical protein
MRRRPASPPDLFEVQAHSATGQAVDRTMATRKPVLLPSNLESSLAILSDDEFARLSAGVAAEKARRGRTTRPSKPALAASAKAPPAKSKRSPEGVSAAKASLVRAAIKAGVKPSAIARQFGLSKAEITEVLRSR